MLSVGTKLGRYEILSQIGVGDRSQRTSPDGRWVVFWSNRSGALRVWKVSIDGGVPVQLTDRVMLNPTVSPDGSQIACLYPETQPNALINKTAIIPFAGGDPVKVLDLPQSFDRPMLACAGRPMGAPSPT